MGISKTGQINLGYSTAKAIFEGLCDSVTLDIPDATQGRMLNVFFPIIAFGNGSVTGFVFDDGVYVYLTLTRIGVTGVFDFRKSEPVSLSG